MKKLLFIGDIVGRPGRDALRALLAGVVKENNIDVTVANVENAAGGFGCTVKIYEELLGFGIDFCTSGNHIFDQKDMVAKIDTLPKFLFPISIFFCSTILLFTT